MVWGVPLYDHREKVNHNDAPDPLDSLFTILNSPFKRAARDTSKTARENFLLT